MSMDSVLLSDIADIQTGPFGSQLHNEDYVAKGTPMVPSSIFRKFLHRHSRR